jgi:putative ATP-dependent endonuclease of OLD family
LREYYTVEDAGELTIGNKPFNYNTLEPKFLKANNNNTINKILGTEKNDNELLIYMNANKTDCALKVFNTTEDMTFPQYILDAIA